MTSKKGNRVPWSGHWEVTGAGMGVVTSVAGKVKGLQEPKEGEPVLRHNPPGEALRKIAQEQVTADAALLEAKLKGKPVARWRGPLTKK